MMNLSDINTSLNLIIDQTSNNLPILAKIIAIPWSIFFINLLLNHRLFYLGIIPRRLIGLPGILFAPLLHSNFNHLFFNTIPLLVLSDFILINGLQYFVIVTLSITCLSGALIWCFARSGIHIGASALISGYWSLLISDIYLQGSATALILGGLSLYYFAGIFLGVFPQGKGISWEGHLFGLIAGLFTSYLLHI